MKPTCNDEITQKVVYNSLKVGSENAVSRDELALLTGYRDRLNRETIEVLRHEKAILTPETGKGYYIPEFTYQGIQDAQRWLDRENRRIDSLKESTKGVKKFIRDAKKQCFPGQLNMFGMGEM